MGCITNFLLISMSTLPGPNNLRESYYANDEEDSCFRGVSQLEAGTKFFLRELQKRGEKIDKIFIVESEDSRNPVSKISEKSLLPFINGNFSGKILNSVEFYRERIWQWIKGEERTYGESEYAKYFSGQVENYEREIAKREKNGTLDSLMTLYPCRESLFKDGDVFLKDVSEQGEENEEAIYSCVNSLCENIQANSPDGSEIRLFLDIQGGRRHHAFIINAAVKMLEMRGITVENSVITNYLVSNNINKKFNHIKDATLNDRIFEMVSGMNEFIKTGRGDTLLDFCEDSNILFPADKKVIKCIKKISEAISLCDVRKFDIELDSFRKTIDEYNQKPNDEKNPLFLTFVRDLKNDYNKFHLLDTGTAKILSQIRWCLNKKLYQQALTLIEAKIPDYIVDQKILYYINDCKLKMLLTRFIDWGLELNRYLLNQNKTEVLEGKEKYVWIKYIVGFENNRSNLRFKFDDELISHINWSPNHVTCSQKNANKKVVKLLDQYHKLCKKRNDVNHAFERANVQINVEQINNQISKFLEMLDNNEVNIDFSKQFDISK